MSRFNYSGINNIERDQPGQVEYNRRKNIGQDTQINTINAKLSELISQAPSGFLPKVYYGLTRGAQTYRFIPNAVLGVTGLTGNIGDAFEILNTNETNLYISAIGIKTDEDQLTIAIQGDYNLDTSTFSIVDMVNGNTMTVTWTTPLSLQDASYLGSYNADDNKGKQITVLHNLETNEENVIYGSVDFNNDGTYNWIRIGGYQNGVNGASIFSVTSATASTVFGLTIPGDTVVAGEDFTYDGISFTTGGLYSVVTASPLAVQSGGSIRGATGATGAPGSPGTPGQNGNTPYILDGTWWIGGTDTGVQAIGQDGTNGTNGQSFQMMSGLYSTDDNYGQSGNVGPNSEVLAQLPTLPQASGMTGYAYVVFDPLTTPLEPFYDLYFANDNDNDWTIIHPYSGLKGQDGTNGYTPYIYNNEWYINGVGTGVMATGSTGPQGPAGLSLFPTSIAISDVSLDLPDAGVGDYIMNAGSSTLTILGESADIGDIVEILTTTTGNIVGNIRGPKGDTGNTGATGATPNITVNANQLPEGSLPTVTQTGTNENPTLTFGIPKGDTGATGPGVPSNNLLINGDFRVNQRGASSYTVNNKYTVDRWMRTEPQGSGGTVTVNTDKTITLTTNAGTNSLLLTQYIEDYNNLLGQKVTLSVQYSNGTIKNTTGTLPTSWPNTNTAYFTIEDSTYSLSLYYDTAGKLGFNFMAKAGQTIILKHCKLEIGNVVTPFSPRPYAEEFLLCQRFYQRLTSLDINFSSPRTATQLRGVCSFKTEMRTPPTATQLHVVEWYDLNSASSFSQSQIDLGVQSDIQSNSAMFAFLSFTGLTTGHVGYISTGTYNIIELDAEIY